jgi:microcystin-dependent protein
MASSYTTSLKIQQMGNGEDSGTWGTITNTNWNLIESAVAGVTQITMANANYTLSNLNGTADEARSMVLAVGGTNSAIYQVVAPLVPKFYVVTNNTVGGYAITIGASTGAIITVPNGYTVQVYCDGTNFYSAQTSSAGNFNVNGNLSVSGNEAVVGNLTVTGTNNLVPTGSLLMWPTGTAPTGYLLCAGAAVSRTTYAALFSAIGTTFGSGDGSTTFNLPNYVDRMPIGSGTIAASVGATGGASTTTISTSNLPSHTHSFSGSFSGSTGTATTGIYDAGHNHLSNCVGLTQSNINWVGTGGGGYYNNNSTYTANASANIQDPGHSHSVSGSVSGTTGSTGSGTAATTISPYLGINFIIKT